MSAREDGGPAFALDSDQAHRTALLKIGASAEREQEYIAEVARLCRGMSLRDYFAAAALPACIAGAEAAGAPGYYEAVAQDAYAIADAMLAERTK